MEEFGPDIAHYKIQVSKATLCKIRLFPSIKIHHNICLNTEVQIQNET